MPIYEYQCTACGHQLEAFQKITEKPLTECPTCHKETLNKLVSATTFQLKGTGWYATDFRDKGKPKQKDEGSDGSEGSSGDTAKETKSTETKAKDKDAKSKDAKDAKSNGSTSQKSSA